VGSSPTASALQMRTEKTVPWSSGYDSWPTPRQRWFKSIRDYSITKVIHVLAEQPGVLASLSRWRSWVQIPSGTLFRLGTTRYANWQSGEAQTFATCGFDSRPCHSEVVTKNRVVFLVAVCNTAVNETSEVDDERFESFTTHSEPRTQVSGYLAGPFVYRHRTAAPQAAKAGSIPARVTQQAQTTKW
jgi:hypothetical protein